MVVTRTLPFSVGLDIRWKGTGKLAASMPRQRLVDEKRESMRSGLAQSGLNIAGLMQDADDQNTVVIDVVENAMAAMNQAADGRPQARINCTDRREFAELLASHLKAGQTGIRDIGPELFNAEGCNIIDVGNGGSAENQPSHPNSNTSL
ncbi:hypothetical protein [Sphingomonas sp. So64.6b]|uniref:hypothetical protein n=1 Tax=Sphingomonas sp. So64.6b TaxID=2997354 RepID=UPI001FCEB652|nr:hypothetical protein [Sphingomonas sp. So64.6b]